MKPLKNSGSGKLPKTTTYDDPHEEQMIACYPDPRPPLSFINKILFKIYEKNRYFFHNISWSWIILHYQRYNQYCWRIEQIGQAKKQVHSQHERIKNSWRERILKWNTNHKFISNWKYCVFLVVNTRQKVIMTTYSQDIQVR